MNWLQRAKRAIYPIASRYFSRAVLVEGILRGTAQPFQCLFVDNSSLMEYLLPRIFQGPISFKRQRKIWIPALKKLLSSPQDIDLCIAVLPDRYDTYFHGLYAFRCQEYVCQTINTSGSWEEITRQFHKKKRQISRNFEAKYGLSYQISHDPIDFDFFYNRMHLPHIKKQFGYLADIDSHDKMKEIFTKGFLFFVIHDSQAVAGALCIVEHDTLIFRRTGILDGDDHHVRCGAQMALYFYLLKIAKEGNCRVLDAMKSRPFLNDGVYRTKREWGATVSPDDESETWVYFFNLGAHEKLVSFYENNPLIASVEGGLYGIVGWKGADITSEECVKELNKLFYAPGINGLKLLVDSSIEPVTYSFNSTTSASSTRQDTK